MGQTLESVPYISTHKSKGGCDILGFAIGYFSEVVEQFRGRRMTRITRSYARMEETVKRYQGSASKDVARNEEQRKRQKDEKSREPERAKHSS